MVVLTAALLKIRSRIKVVIHVVRGVSGEEIDTRRGARSLASSSIGESGSTRSSIAAEKLTVTDVMLTEEILVAEDRALVEGVGIVADNALLLESQGRSVLDIVDTSTVGIVGSHISRIIGDFNLVQHVIQTIHGIFGAGGSQRCRARGGVRVRCEVQMIDWDGGDNGRRGNGGRA